MSPAARDVSVVPAVWTTMSGDEAGTEALGVALARHLEPGDIVALSGPLGAGKTRLVAGIARGLEAAAHVRSPTFTLVNEYRGRLRLLHVDLYRLESREVAGLGLDEALDDAAVVVEWGERLPVSWWRDALRIAIEPEAGTRRRVRAEAGASRARTLLTAWSNAAGGGPDDRERSRDDRERL